MKIEKVTSESIPRLLPQPSTPEPSMITMCFPLLEDVYQIHLPGEKLSELQTDTHTGPVTTLPDPHSLPALLLFWYLGHVSLH